VKFAESARLDAKVGTFLNLLECEERLGRISSARQNAQRAIDLAKAQGDDRLGLARDRFAALDRRAPRLTARLVSSAPTGAHVSRDNVDVGPGSLGTPLPVEPGEHVIVVQATNRSDRSFRVTMAEGETKTIDVDVGAEVPSTTPANTRPQAVEKGSMHRVRELGRCLRRRREVSGRQERREAVRRRPHRECVIERRSFPKEACALPSAKGVDRSRRHEIA